MISSYRYIWRLFDRGERRRFIALMAATLAMAVFEVGGVAVIFPFLSVISDPSLLDSQPILRMICDFFGATTPRQGQVVIGLGALTVIVTGMMVRAAVTYAQFRFSLMRSYSLASRMLHGYLAQDYVWHVTRNSSELATGVLSEIDQVVRESILPSVLLISNLLVIILISGLIFIVSPLVAVTMTTLLLAVYVGVFMLLRERLSEIGTARIRANRRRFRTIQEITGGLKEHKILGMERQSLQRFRSAAEEMARQQTMSQIFGRLPRFAVEAAVYGGFILFVLAAVLLWDAVIEAALPLLGLLGMAATRLFPALQTFYQQLSLMRFSAPALSRLITNLDQAPIGLLPQPVNPLPLHSAIRLQEIRFGYPGADRPGIDGVSLEIPARSSVGLVGGTGAGKTTLVDLLLGLLRPDGGQLVVDGEALEGETLLRWQRNIGYVPQQIFLIDDSIAANIALGTYGAPDMEAVERAARTAQVHDFVISELPAGYATTVGESGVRLSGGQRQRIGIARALYRDPEVLIFDEATSALDNATEKTLMEAVERLSGSKTVVMIAHRLSTVRGCDRIVMLEQGRIVAEGGYDDLLESSIKFQRIADA